MKGAVRGSPASRRGNGGSLQGVWDLAQDRLQNLRSRTPKQPPIHFLRAQFLDNLRVADIREPLHWMDTRAVLIRTTCFHLTTIAMIAVWDCGADCPQPVSNLRWICASKLQGVVSERFARCEQKKLQTGLGFQAPPDMNCSSGYRVRSERIEIHRNYLARW